MENFNVAEKVLNCTKDTYQMNPGKESITSYFIADAFDKLLGKHIFDKDDIDFMQLIDGDNKIINIDYLDMGSISLRIGVINDEAVIAGTMDNEQSINITIGNQHVTSIITYPEDVNSITEKKSVLIDKKDARDFYLARLENGELAYEGSLKPVDARTGEKEYFDFNYTGSDRVGQSSLLKRIVDSIANSSLVTVSTSNRLHLLSNYSDSVFGKLKEKLEQHRLIKPAPSKRRTLKND